MNGLAGSMRDQLRNMFRVRRERRVERRGARPRIGVGVVRGDVRLTIHAGMSDELWQWLLEHDWREVTFRPDRRRYREIPTSWVTRLIDCNPEDRAAVMTVAISKAAYKPAANDPTVLPSYVQRK
jgi:hypothetical protein